MKSFSDWTQELAESNNHEPEPEKYTVDCEGERCSKCDGKGYIRGLKCLEDCPACTPLTCSGVGCCKVGVPNYWAGDYQFYCGGSPRCCP